MFTEYAFELETSTLRATTHGAVAGPICGRLQSEVFWNRYCVWLKSSPLPKLNTVEGTTFYLLPLWGTWPIVHFSGGGHSGKSVAQEMLSLLCFNGLYVLNPTEAAFADDLHNLRATVCLDEAEEFERPAQVTRAIRSMMNAAYVQGAPLRRKKDPRSGLSVSRHNYGTIFLASMRGLEDVTADRAIIIPTRAAPNDQRVNLPRPIDEGRNDPKKYKRLRNMAYSMTLTHWQQFSDARNRVQPPLDKGGNSLIAGRQWELWQPAVVMAKVCGGREEGAEPRWEAIPRAWNGRIPSGRGLCDITKIDVQIACRSARRRENDAFPPDFLSDLEGRFGPERG